MSDTIFPLLKTSTWGQANSAADSDTSTFSNTVDAVGSLVGSSLRDVGDQLILKTLENCSGNRTRAAEVLEIGVRTLFNRLKSLQVRV